MRTAYFDCFSGISGDMTLGALIDAGLDTDKLQAELSKLDISEYELVFSKSVKQGITGTQFQVKLDHEHAQSHSHRSLTDILKLIAESELDSTVKETASEIFNRLAEAEAKIHNKAKDEIHFHEVGAVDSIVDIVGASIGLHLLEIEEIYASKITLGSGFVKCAHGVMPVPAPATLELLSGTPVRQTDIEVELTTPTGAAIITTLASQFGPMQDMIIDSIGYGAGQRELENQPNLLRVCIGRKKKKYDVDRIVLIETNIDDMPSEFLGYLMDKLFEAGALDLYFTPIQMKKNRPATKISVLVKHEKLDSIAEIILTETTTFGLRFHEVERKKLPRKIVPVDTKFGVINVKQGYLEDEIIKAIPEYEDCKRLAQEYNVPISQVYEEAIKNTDIFQNTF